MTPKQHALLRELVTASGGDAVFRPSSIDRVMLCPGSVVMGARVPQQKGSFNKYTDAGTAAHKVVEDALRGVRTPEEWCDRKVILDAATDRGVYVDEEMVDAANLYLSVVESRMTPTTEMFIEHRLSLAPLDPSDPLFAENRGTGDTVLVDRSARKITIIDLKYGQGVKVPGDSPQLRDYALMAMVTFSADGGGWDTIETIIVQPRDRDEEQRIKPVLFTASDLLDGFLPEIAAAMEGALDVNAPLTPGKKQCRWCPASGQDARGAPVCPALAQETFHIAASAFAAAGMPSHNASSAMVPIPAAVSIAPDPVPPGGIQLPSPLDLSPSDIADILERRTLYDAFIEGVEKRAVAMLTAGLKVPGWRLKPRTGNRKFADLEEAPAQLRALGVQTTAMYTEPKLRTPAQVEKFVPKDKKHLFDALIVRPEGEATLVRADAEGAIVATGFTPYVPLVTAAIPPGFRPT